MSAELPFGVPRRTSDDRAYMGGCRSNIYLRKEGGESLGSAGGDGVIEKLIPALDDETSPFLRYLDPYGDTVFNPQQAEAFASELRVRSSSLSSESERESVEQIVSLAEQCANGIHVYLWFVGD